jgi:Uma2 family endonuclease
MENMAQTLAPPDPREWHDRDQLVVLHGITWPQYVALNDAQGEAGQPRMCFLDGKLELVTVSRHHEVVKTLLARLLEAYAEETGVDLNGYGQTTWRDELKNAGAEADECYMVGDPKPVPDLVVEVVHTSGGINKLEIYRRLGVPEVWFWINGLIYAYHLDGQYREVHESVVMAGIDFDILARVIGATPESGQTAAVRAYRESLRARP